MGRKLRSALAVLDSTRAGLRFVAYMRVSTEEQAKGYGVEYQEERILGYGDRKGWTHVGSYIDDGVSGELPAYERPELRELMEGARRTPLPFDVVIVLEERAIGRRGEAFWPWVWELQSIGVFVAVVADDYDNTTEEGRKKMRAGADYAETEWVKIRQRTQGGIQRKAESGGYVGGNPPFGYRIENKGQLGRSRLVPDDAPLGEASCARMARRRFVAVRSWERVAEHLNQEGFRTRSGKLWTGNNIRGRMSNPALWTARMVWRDKEAVKDAHGKPVFGPRTEIPLPPIFTDTEVKEFEDALALARQGRPSRRQERCYPLSGHIPSSCGKGYIGQSNKGHGYFYYRCSGRPGTGRGDCSCPTLPAKGTEEAVWSIFRKSLSDPEHLENMARQKLSDHASRAEAASEKVAALKRQVREQSDVIQFSTTSAARQAVARGLSPEEAQALIDRTVGPLNKELLELEKSLRTAEGWLLEASEMEQQIERVRRLIHLARQHLTNPSLDQQREIYDLLGAEVEILKFPPSARVGLPCPVRAWFVAQGRGIPVVTDGHWERIQQEVGGVLLREDARGAMEAFLAKASTGEKWRSLSDLRRFSRWRSLGAWEGAMRLLEDAEAIPVDLEEPRPEVAVSIKPYGVSNDGAGAQFPSVQGPSTMIGITLTLTA